jgi:predicted dehydrogenase
VANYLTQDLVLYENDSAPQDGNWHELAVLGVTEGRMIRFKVNKREPLREELDAFVSSVRRGTAPPVRGEDGLLALAVAQRLVESGMSGQANLLDEGHGFAWPPVAQRARPTGQPLEGTALVEALS